MNDQLEALVTLQDIDVLLHESRNPAVVEEKQRLGFPVDKVAPLERARERIASQIDDRLLQTYERMSRRHLRVVVPIHGATCPGCHMNLPTATGRPPAGRIHYENCENCGRILYRL